MTLVVHHLENSRSQRVLWLLEELGVPYEVRRYARDPKTMLAPPELKAVHPLGRSPVVVEAPGAEPRIETGAIVEWLLERHDPDGRMRPKPGGAAFDEHRMWLHFAEGSAMPPLLMALVAGRIESAPMPFFVRPVARAIAGQIRRTMVERTTPSQLDFVAARLGRRDWLVDVPGGGPSGADVMMSFPLEAAKSRGLLDAARHPTLAAYVERIHARPAWRRARERGGPYAFE